MERQHQEKYGQKALTFQQLKVFFCDKAVSLKEPNAFQTMNQLSKTPDHKKRFVIFNVNMRESFEKQMLMDYDTLYREAFEDIRHLLKDVDNPFLHTLPSRKLIKPL